MVTDTDELLRCFCFSGYHSNYLRQQVFRATGDDPFSDSAAFSQGSTRQHEHQLYNDSSIEKRWRVLGRYSSIDVWSDAECSDLHPSTYLASDDYRPRLYFCGVACYPLRYSSFSYYGKKPNPGMLCLTRIQDDSTIMATSHRLRHLASL